MAFENIGKKITQSGQDVIQKSKNFTEVSRLETEIKNLEKENDRSYITIGKYYYEKAKSQPDADIAQAVGAVSKNLREIRNRQDRIRDLKGIVQCPGCGSDVDKESTFCEHCGTRLIEIVPDTSGYGSCPGCGAAVREGQKFCTRCGQKLDVIIRTHQTPASAAKIVCPSCGRQLEEGMAFCIYCGARAEAAQGQEAVPEAQEVHPAREEPAQTAQTQPQETVPEPQTPASPVQEAPEEPQAQASPAEVTSVDPQAPAASDQEAAAEPQALTSQMPGSEFTWQEYQETAENAMPVFCTACGMLLEPDMKYCTGCGARVEQTDDAVEVC